MSSTKHAMLVLLLTCNLLLAEQPSTTEPAVIAATDTEALKAAIGSQVVVEGYISKAAWSRSGRVMNIEFLDSVLLGAVFERQRAKLDEAFGGDLAAALRDAKVRLKGRLIEYGGYVESLKGRPQIIINDASQITILQPAPPPTTQQQ
ncbi:hypothetical protein [Fontivita pretiosa]|uniref:hypothetical protein n=1 Tax=Fontivita pretiosa TaxID=2989684 RepID=UPI003D1694C3